MGKQRALIFNLSKYKPNFQGDRLGSEMDGKNLDYALKQLKISVKHGDDEETNKEEILKMIRQQRKHKDDTLFVFLLTHGMYGKVAAFDELFDVSELFKAVQEVGDLSQPTVFFIQACQDIQGGRENWSCIPPCKNVYVVYAATPGHPAKRNEKKGSWIITWFTKIIQRMKLEDSIELSQFSIRLTQLIKNESVNNNFKQVPLTCSTLMEKLDMTRLKEDSRCPIETVESSDQTEQIVDDTLANTDQLRSLNVTQELLLTTQPIYDIPQNHDGLAVLVEKTLESKQLRQKFKMAYKQIGFKEKNIKFYTSVNDILGNLDTKQEYQCLFVAIANDSRTSTENDEDDIFNLLNKFKNISPFSLKPKIFLMNSSNRGFTPSNKPNSVSPVQDPPSQHAQADAEVSQNAEAENPTQGNVLKEEDVYDADFLFVLPSNVDKSQVSIPENSRFFFVNKIVDAIPISKPTSNDKNINFIDIILQLNKQLKSEPKSPAYDQIASFCSTLSAQLVFPVAPRTRE